jgi:hypothetical protein
MSLPQGHTLSLSRGRRMVSDILHLARGIPLVKVERQISIPEVAEARDLAAPKPGWYPVLLKSFALACMRLPELRRSVLTVPYTRLYQHACTVASVTIEREIDGEPAVFFFHVREPERKPLSQIHDRFQRVKTEPLEKVPDFRRSLSLLRFPRPIRRFIQNVGMFWGGPWREKYGGTFAASSTLAAGATLTLPCTPLSSVFTFDEVKPDGRMTLHLAWDHRVFDGMTAARGLVETERMLRGPILAELHSLARPARLAV